LGVEVTISVVGFVVCNVILGLKLVDSELEIVNKLVGFKVLA
jgi:hypothetical protein